MMLSGTVALALWAWRGRASVLQQAIGSAF
jgi:hypothetical protein